MWILWAGSLLCSASYTMCVPFLPLFLYDLGVQGDAVHVWSGAVLSAAFLVGAVMGPFWGVLADRFGKRRMVIRAGIGLSVVYALFAVVHGPWQLLAVRLLQGFVAGFIPASMALVASFTPEKRMGWSLGMMQAGTMSGGILGPLLGGLLAEGFGMRLSFAAAAVLLVLATTAVAAFVREAPPRAEPTADAHRPARSAETESAVASPLKPRFVFSRAILAMLALLFMYQLCVNTLQPIVPLHIAEMKHGSTGAVLTSGFVLSLVGIAGMIASPLWGRLGSSLPSGRILQLCLLGAGLIVMLQSWTAAVWQFTLVQFVYGFCMAGIAPTVNTLMVRHTDRAVRGRMFGLTSSANQLGGMAGPLLGGSLGLWLGNRWVFMAVGFALLAAGAATSLLLQRQLAEKALTSGPGSSTLEA
ncbi:MFS transporter [Paenibacillus athensensis]|uniref:MFS transporter n=1 Tax=Paenibacillus athensensis TaxID=1967502 RepID=UPI001E440973|nr:MFS transporter [Paenibacillus athensensis]